MLLSFGGSMHKTFYGILVSVIFMRRLGLLIMGVGRG